MWSMYCGVVLNILYQHFLGSTLSHPCLENRNIDLHLYMQSAISSTVYSYIAVYVLSLDSRRNIA